jgi:hypothetical protein
MANQFDRIVGGVGPISTMSGSVTRLVDNIAVEVRGVSSERAAIALADVLRRRASDIAEHVVRNAVVEAYLPAEPAEH